MKTDKTMGRIEELQKLANHARYLIIETLINSGLGHPGGSLSSIDIMTALKWDPLFGWLTIF